LLDEVEDAQLMPLLKERIERSDFVDVNLNDL
jgi:hypothetical protein